MIKTRQVRQVEIATEVKEFNALCDLEVEVGTNGLQGGDSGHGSRTYFRIKDLASTDISASVKTYPRNEITIQLGGDDELDQFIRVLEFAVKKLKKQRDGRKS